MYNAIKFFYDSWEWIAGIGVIVGIISGLAAMLGIRKKQERKHKNRYMQTIVSMLVFVIACLFIILSFLSNRIFTIVPEVINKEVSVASDELYKNGLTVKYPEGEPRENDFQARVYKQSIDAHRIVLRGTSVEIGFRKPDDIEETTSIDIPTETLVTEKNTEMVTEKETETEFKTKSNKIKVPNVVGMEQDKAIEILTKLGLEFQVWWSEEDNIDADKYFIKEQSIDAGIEVPQKTLIRLRLTVKK